MTAKTHGYITKEIELDQIYRFILKWFDPAAKVNRYENKFGESNEMAVYFNYKGEERRLFAIVYKSRKFSKTGEKERQIFLDLGYWGSSVEIMKSIISYFSGWIDENDCDSEDPYYIEAHPEGVMPNIIKITRAELNKRMGGTVVIIDEEE
ncbi:MAG: hypothetical protein GX299_06110 [Epulopiscium sp.]|nr:hypothetical protein [Candidatus Epulonipiscium sp.]